MYTHGKRSLETHVESEDYVELSVGWHKLSQTALRQ